MNTNKKGFKKRTRSFGYAFAGLYELVKSEPNARIHFLATVRTLIAVFVF